MRNCLYCKYYNQTSNACTSPKSLELAIFNPQKDQDCRGLWWDKAENPVVKDEAFVNKYCKGTKCPYYFETNNICTRPSKCPFVDTKETLFQNVDFENEI